MVAPLNPAQSLQKIQSQRLWRGRNGSIRRWILMRQVRIARAAGVANVDASSTKAKRRDGAEEAIFTIPFVIPTLQRITFNNQ